MEELDIDPKGLTIVVHDREDMTLEYIESGHIDSTLINELPRRKRRGIL